MVVACPTAKAMVSTIRPKASETPINPMPTTGNAAAGTALPQPPRRSQNVPIGSFHTAIQSKPVGAGRILTVLI